MKNHPMDRLLAQMKKRKAKEPKGEKVVNSKLTETEVRAIRLGHRLGYSTDELSKIYTVHLRGRTGDPKLQITRQQIWRIVTKKDWKHVPDVEMTPEVQAAMGALKGENISSDPVTFSSS